MIIRYVYKSINLGARLNLSSEVKLFQIKTFKHFFSFIRSSSKMRGDSITSLGRYFFRLGEMVYKAPVQSRPFHSITN